MSIKQNGRSAGLASHSAGLPDFRNLGVVLRILVLVNGLAVAALLVRNARLDALFGEALEMAVRVEFPLVLSVAALFTLQPALRRLRYWGGVAAVLATVAAVALATEALLAPVLVDDAGPRDLFWTVVAAAASLFYFYQRSAAQAPALAEARLLALTARMRPHFLFNSLNGVLGVLRRDPRRAEQGLEELADLFRALMQDNRELVPLGDEISLCERYLSLENLRLGERLRVDWQRDPAAEAVLVPPLMLQPLVENAVYHGIEPAAAPGTVSIAIVRRGPEVLITIANPCLEAASHHIGNRMALDNIRERLMLFYDLEATLDTEQDGQTFKVRILLPFRSSDR